MPHFKQVVKTFRSTFPCKLRSLVIPSLTAGIVLLGLAVSGAQAAMVTVFSGNQTAWEAAAGSPAVLVDFNSAPPPGFALTLGSSLPGTFALDLSGGVFNGVYRDRADDDQITKPLITALGSGVTAVGADWNPAFNGLGTGIKLFLTFVDSTSQFVTTEIPNTFAGEFFGIVSDMAIRSIRFDEGTQGGASALFETFELDNARFVSAVPIPAALPLFLSALAAVGLVGRRRKRLAAV